MQKDSMTMQQNVNENLKIWLIGIEANEVDKSYLIAKGEMEKKITFDF